MTEPTRADVYREVAALVNVLPPRYRPQDVAALLHESAAQIDAEMGREVTMVEGFCGVRPAHEPHEWRFLRCNGVPPEGREATCLICDGTGPLRPGQGGTLVCVEDCTVGREATCKHPEPITNRKGVTACMDCLTILSPPPTAGREASPDANFHAECWTHHPDGTPCPSGREATPEYEQGYRDGESSVAADWQIALDEVLPDGVEAKPSQVAAYIESLTSPARGTS